jgi:MFS transporter, DHA1 family, multidrug resistance protein
VFSYSAAFYITGGLLFLAGTIVLIGVQESFSPILQESGKRPGFMTAWKSILSAPAVITVYLMRFSSQLASNIILPVAPLFIRAISSESASVNTTTGLVVGVSSATATISALYMGRLGDRIGHRKVVIASALFASVLYILHWWVTSAWQLLALQALVGISAGGIVTSISALLVRISKPGQEGAIFGLDNSIMSAARTVSPMVGASIAHWFDLRAAFLGAVFLYAALSLLTFRRLPASDKVIRDELPAGMKNS